MNKRPVLYNPDAPLAHYEEAGKRYQQVKSSLGFGIIMPIISLICGTSCIIYNPWLMALFALFAFPFTLLSIIGCKTRRAALCLISIPLAVVAAIISAMSGELTAPLGIAAYLFSAFAEFRAIPAINDFFKLKELPGFPFFDPSMDELTFAALDRRGADEFIEGELYTEKTMKRFKPEELEPSEEMAEIVTGVSLKKDGDDSPQLSETEAAVSVSAKQPASLTEPPADSGETPYERMIKVRVENNNKEISDVELFG